MRIVILHHHVLEDESAEQRDVIVQCRAIAAALTSSGHEAISMDCTLDLETLATRLRDADPDLVFNLVESLGGTDRLMPLATLLLEALQISFTGCGTESILATNNKPAAKRGLRTAGLPTPDWISSDGDRYDSELLAPWPSAGRRMIIKPVWEHASHGMSDNSVGHWETKEAVARTIDDWTRRHRGRPHFAERFIEGREFNLSLLAEPGQTAPRVLPAAEIDFSSFPPDKPRIVGYLAKWDPESMEYQQTPRRCEFPDADQELLDELAALARACWTLFRLRGYARVDFRVDTEGRPWILEVNANPCLAPDAGYAAALQRAGISWEAAIQRILDDALLPRSCC